MRDSGSRYSFPSNVRLYRSRLALLMFALSMDAMAAPAIAHMDKPTVGLINHSAIVYSANTGKMYVVDQPHSAVSIISAAGTVKSVKVGSGPEAIAVNNQTGVVYVANDGSRSISVIDGKSDSVMATVATAARPYAIAVDESTNKVYVSNTFSDMLTVIDGKTNVASNTKTGSADAILVDATRKQLYLMGYESDGLTVLNLETNATTKISAGGMHLWGIIQVGKTIYVTHVQDATVAAIDTETNSVTNMTTGTMPCAIAANPTTGEVYVANYGDGSVTIIDGLSGTVAGTIMVGRHP
jgi:YVTN family beta-propeller protein